MLKPKNIKILIPLFALILFMFFLLSYLTNRDNNIRFRSEDDFLVTITDELLRYEIETGALPENLQNLIPKYLRGDMLLDKNGKPKYIYSKKNRQVKLAKGFKKNGLLTNRFIEMIAFLPKKQEEPVSSKKHLSNTKTLQSSQNPKPADSAKITSNKTKDLLIPQTPKIAEPANKDYVFEAELYSETNYGWEIHQDKTVANGIYLHTKEGIANGPGQKIHHVGSFYDIQTTPKKTSLKYFLNLPQAGEFYIYGRMWTTSSHCSNNIHVKLNNQPFYKMTNRIPFRWVWTNASNGKKLKLKKGMNTIELFIHEDGIRIDQFILSQKKMSGSKMLKANLIPQTMKNHSKIHMMYDYKSMIFSEKKNLEVNISLRSFQKINADLMITTRFEKVGKNQQDIILLNKQIKQQNLKLLTFIKIPFHKVNIQALASGEYLLKTTLTANGKIIAEYAKPMMKPFKWKVSEMINRFISNYDSGPYDGNQDGEKPWTDFKITSYSKFGVMDFGLETINNSLHAPQNKTIYAKTKIYIPEEGDYLVKIQSDDQLILWIDGQTILRNNSRRPVTRVAAKRNVYLEKGVHTIKIRVNQKDYAQYKYYDGRWQAYIRFRTTNDNVSNIRGK